MSAAATSDVANGRKYIDAHRLRHLRLVMRLRPSATASAATTVAGTEKSSELDACCRTAVQNVESVEHLLVAGARPTNSRAPPGSDLVERVHDRLRERQEEHRAEEQERGQDEQESRALPALEVRPGKDEAIPLPHDVSTSLSPLARESGLGVREPASP